MVQSTSFSYEGKFSQNFQKRIFILNKTQIADIYGNNVCALLSSSSSCSLKTPTLFRPACLPPI